MKTLLIIREDCWIFYSECYPTWQIERTAARKNSHLKLYQKLLLFPMSEQFCCIVCYMFENKDFYGFIKNAIFMPDDYIHNSK